MKKKIWKKLLFPLRNVAKNKRNIFFSNKNLYYSVNLNLNRSMNSLYPMDCIFHLNTNLGVIHKRGHHLLKRFLNPTLYPSRPVLLQNTISFIKKSSFGSPVSPLIVDVFYGLPLTKGWTLNQALKGSFFYTLRWAWDQISTDLGRR